MRRRAWSTVVSLSVALSAACADNVAPTAPIAANAVRAMPRGPAFAILADGMNGSTYYQSFTLAGVYKPSVPAPVFDVFGNPYDPTALATLGVSVTASDLFTGLPSNVTAQAWQPLAPTAWQPTDFDVAIHSRDQWYAPAAPFAAMHGTECAPFQLGEFQPMRDPSALRQATSVSGTPGGAHMVATYDDMNYRCRNHMMTALKDPGYGMIFVTPNAMVDFSTGEASIKFALATLRTSGRDWVDIWITPWADNLKLPLDASLSGVDMQGPPRRAIHVRMIPELAGYTKSAFEAYYVNDFAERKLPVATAAGYESILTPISTRRDTFELRISRTHLSFGITKPASPLVVANTPTAWSATAVAPASMKWIDTPIPPLSFTQGVVQFGHHSFNPAAAPPNPALASDPMFASMQNLGGTWHWDDFQISPAVPFTIIPSLSKNSFGRYADAASPTATLATATPTLGYLRFAAYGDGIQVSADSVNWFTAQRQSEKLNVRGRFHSYWMPCPPGVTTVYFRNVSGGGEDSPQVAGGPWIVRDVAFWSLNGALTGSGTSDAGGQTSGGRAGAGEN